MKSFLNSSAGKMRANFQRGREGQAGLETALQLGEALDTQLQYPFLLFLNRDNRRIFAYPVLRNAILLETFHTGVYLGSKKSRFSIIINS